jgi:ligand-binding sensor domain-containing protein/signal transduction histidine kinase
MRFPSFSFSILFIGVLSIHSVFSQPLNPAKELTQYNIDHWEGDKAPSNVVHMIQTRDGYLWMATLSGLVRFDGLKFTAYDNFSTPSIAATGFKCLYEDKHQNLWIGSNGAGLFLKKPNRFKKYEVPFGSGSNNIERIFLDSKENLWLCTLKGLIKFKDSTFSLVQVKGKSADSDFPMYDIAEDDQGVIWVGSSDGVLKYENGELKKYTWKGISLAGEIVAMHITYDQKLWLASYGNGVFVASHDTLTKVYVPDGFKHPTSILEDRNNNVWVGSEFGVVRYKDNLASYIEAAKGLSSNNVTALCEDHEGSIWLGTYYSGLNRLREGAFTNYTVLNGLTHNTVHSIFQSANGTIFLGNESNVTFYRDGIFTKLSKQFPELAGVRIRDIGEDTDGTLWIASYDGVFSIKGNKIRKFTIQDGLSNTQARVVFVDNKQVWIGTREGLNFWQNGKWKIYSVKEGLQNDFIMSILRLHDGSLIVGTTDGIFKLKRDMFEPFVTDKGQFSSTIFRTYEDKENYLWIGTTYGLVCVKDNRLYNFSDTHKLLSGNIYQPLEDSLGALWLTSSVGVVRILKSELLHRMMSDTVTLHPRLFDKSSGLRTNELTPTSKALVSRDGTIWFPTLEGVAVIDPSNILINKTPPPLIIEKLMVGGREYDTFDHLTIPPGSRNIEIHYTGLSFMIPKKVSFKYKLDGFDKEWNDVGDRRIAYYTSLPPGNYSFSLAACNNDGVWNVKEGALTFHVEKALWQTAPFYIMIVLVTGLLIFGIIDYRTRRVKQLNRVLEEKIDERTSQVLSQKEEIESQRDDIETKRSELERARNVIEEQYEKLREVNESLEGKVEERTKELSNAYSELKLAVNELDDFVYKSSHDIKGPLARLQGLCNLALIEAGTLPSREHLIMLQKESVLANRVIEKLSHAHATKNHIVNLSSVNLKNLFGEILDQLMAIRTEELKSIIFTLEVDHDINLVCDHALLKEVFYNLLENSVVFRSESDSKVLVKSKLNGTNVSVTITDNGIGIHEKVKGQIFKMFVKGSERSQGLGLGLYIVKNGIKILKGSVQLVNSKEGETVFEVTLPLKYS